MGPEMAVRRGVEGTQKPLTEQAGPMARRSASGADLHLIPRGGLFVLAGVAGAAGITHIDTMSQLEHRCF